MKNIKFIGLSFMCLFVLLYCSTNAQAQALNLPPNPHDFPDLGPPKSNIRDSLKTNQVVYGPTGYQFRADPNLSFVYKLAGDDKTVHLATSFKFDPNADTTFNLGSGIDFVYRVKYVSKDAQTGLKAHLIIIGCQIDTQTQAISSYAFFYVDQKDDEIPNPKDFSHVIKLGNILPGILEEKSGIFAMYDHLSNSIFRVADTNADNIPDGKIGAAFCTCTPKENLTDSPSYIRIENEYSIRSARKNGVVNTYTDSPPFDGVSDITDTQAVGERKPLIVSSYFGGLTKVRVNSAVGSFIKVETPNAELLGSGTCDNNGYALIDLSRALLTSESIIARDTTRNLSSRTHYVFDRPTDVPNPAFLETYPLTFGQNTYTLTGLGFTTSTVVSIWLGPDEYVCSVQYVSDTTLTITTPSNFTDDPQRAFLIAKEPTQPTSTQRGTFVMVK